MKGLRGAMLTGKQFLALLGLLGAGLGLSYALHEPLVFGFVPGFLFLLYFSLQNGLSTKEAWHTSISGINRAKEVIWILLLVGLLMPAWTESGTIEAMVSAGLSLLKPELLLTFSFLFSCVVSMILGTSTGTLSSVGIPLMGVAMHLGVPLPYIAGALISGAFLGDRTSPFSSASRLVAASSGTSFRKHGFALVPTTVGALLVSTMFYLLLDWNGQWGAEQSLSDTGTAGSVLLYIPVIVLIVSILLRWKSKYAFLLSIALAIVIGSVVGETPWLKWPVYLWKGVPPAGEGLLPSKGLVDMIGLMALIALASAFNALLERTGTLQPYIAKWIGGSTTLTAFTVKTGALGFVLSLLACNQTLPIMMSSRSILPHWEARFPREHLSRVTADSTMLFPAMVPWNLVTVLCSKILGISIEQYLPFAVFLLILPLLTLLYSLRSGNRV